MTPEDVILRAAFRPCHPEEPQATKDLVLTLKTKNRSFTTFRTTPEDVILRAFFPEGSGLAS